VDRANLKPADGRDWYRVTGKMCLGGGMHCPSASSFKISLHHFYVKSKTKHGKQKTVNAFVILSAAVIDVRYFYSLLDDLKFSNFASKTIAVLACLYFLLDDASIRPLLMI